MIEQLYDIDNLYRAFKQVKKVSGWKEQTQRYDEYVIDNIASLSKQLMNGTYRPQNPNRFTINERGKIREIESYSINDRIVQGCFVANVLTPLCIKKLIYDNAASIKGRGTDFFRRRLDKHLKDFLRRNDEGYILVGDFSKYFDNIWHDSFIDTLKKFGADEEVLSFTKLLLKQHEIDVSYMTEDEYKECMKKVFNSLEYYKVDRSVLNKEKMMRKSLGIGSQIAQIAGVIVPYRIDNYCKIVKGIKAYGRYMDDFYVIHNDKEFLKQLIKDIDSICEDIGIILNKKKTQIINLRHCFTILKTKYIIRDGKILKFADKDSFKRERRKIKRFKEKCDKGEMSVKDAIRSYESWRGAMIKRFGRKRVSYTDDFFDNIFKGDYYGRKRET